MRGRLFATVEAKNVHGMPLLEGGAAGGHGALPGGPRGRLHRGAGRRAPPVVTSLLPWLTSLTSLAARRPQATRWTSIRSTSTIRPSSLVRVTQGRRCGLTLSASKICDAFWSYLALTVLNHSGCSVRL